MNRIGANRRFDMLNIAWVFGVVLILFLPHVSNAEDASISVVVSSHIRPFVSAYEGFRSALNRDLSVQFMDDNPELVRHRISNEKYSLVAAIGPAAAELVWSALPPATPKLCLMVLDPQELLGRSDLCGVHLRIPASEQFRQIALKFGSMQRVGVLYNEKENAWWVKEAASAAEEEGLVLIPLEVKKRSDVSPTFKSATTRLDILLFIPDSVVISEVMISYLVRKALLKGIAPVGYNRFFQETGAVMSFIIDYKKCGEVAAEEARQLLSGGACSLSPPPFTVGWNDKAWKVVRRAREAAGRSREGSEQ